jgi:serine/threonine-protein kinase HipA
MERELAVFMDIERTPLSVGRLWVRDKGRGETSGFEYDPAWIRRPGAFALGPNLPLGAGLYPSGEGLFNEFRDPAPDRWGQMIMRHYERQRAKLAGAEPRQLKGMDFLSGVDDQTRLGALRFKRPGEDDFITKGGNPVPPLVDLSKLLSAADRVEKGKERKRDLDILLAPAGSLGGARPKATIRDRDGRLHLAKFPWDKDEWPVILWETVLLHLAEAAGVTIAPFRLEPVGLKRVLLAARFDRDGVDLRVPYVSVCTMLGAKDHETRSYLEIVDALRQSGAAPTEDAHQLWRRMVFNVLVSNTDDHVRNHGFLWGGQGWRLSPAFDMNPRPTHKHERIHQMALNEVETTGSLDLVQEVIGYFGLSKNEARQITGEVGAAVAQWKIVAARLGLSRNDLEFMGSAFEHDDLKQALAARTVVAVPKSLSPRKTVETNTPKKGAKAKARSRPKARRPT